MRDLAEILGLSPVIPVLTISRIEDALPIGRALVEGGLPVLEVTLRTPVALDVIRQMRKIPGAVVGAGTVLAARQLKEAADAGAEFMVSPGLTETVVAAAAEEQCQLLPGIATASDIMRALDLGLRHLKFFPAMAAGGLSALKAFAAVFADVRFCPTGGITQDDAARWLDVPSVTCIGGSWLVPSGEAIDPDAISARARRAAALRRSAA